eukprot:g1345.t1
MSASVELKNMNGLYIGDEVRVVAIVRLSDRAVLASLVPTPEGASRSVKKKKKTEQEKELNKLLGSKQLMSATTKKVRTAYDAAGLNGSRPVVQPSANISEGDLYYQASTTSSGSGSDYGIWHPVWKPIPNDTWIEVTHAVYPTELHGSWVWTLPGSGTWYNTGRTLVFPTPPNSEVSKVHAEAIKFLSNNCSVSISHEWPQLESDVFGLCAREKGYDSIQFEPSQGQVPWGTFTLAGLTEMVAVNVDGDKTCGVEQPESTPLRQGWRASKRCRCVNQPIPKTCGLMPSPPYPLNITGEVPRLCENGNGVSFIHNLNEYHSPDTDGMEADDLWLRSLCSDGDALDAEDTIFKDIEMQFEDEEEEKEEDANGGKERIETLSEVMCRKAASAWLSKEEIYRVLKDPGSSGFRVAKRVQKKPPSGTLILYDRRSEVTRRFRKDGHSFFTRPGKTKATRENHSKLKIKNGDLVVDEIMACYARNEHLCRRAYYLLANGERSSGKYALVHYLSIRHNLNDKPAPPSDASKVVKSSSLQMMADQNSADNSDDSKIVGIDEKLPSDDTWHSSDVADNISSQTHQLFEDVFRQLSSMKDDEQIRAIVDEVSRTDATGLNLLHYVCLFGRSSLVSRILLVGMSVDARTGSELRETPLHLAARSGFENTVQELLRHGADPTIRDSRGVDAARKATMAGHEDLGKLLRVAAQSWCQIRSIDPRTKRPPDPETSFDASRLPESTPTIVNRTQYRAVGKRVLERSLSDMSIHERCAFIRSGSVGSEAEAGIIKSSSSTTGGTGTILSSTGGVSSAKSSDVSEESAHLSSNIMSNAEQLKLTGVMSLMNEEEMRRVEKEAELIKRSMRGWLQRRNFLKLRDATRLIQALQRKKRDRRERMREKRRREIAANTIRRSIKIWVERAKSVIALDARSQNLAATAIQKWTRVCQSRRHSKMPQKKRHRVAKIASDASP